MGVYPDLRSRMGVYPDLGGRTNKKMRPVYNVRLMHIQCTSILPILFLNLFLKVLIAELIHVLPGALGNHIPAIIPGIQGCIFYRSIFRENLNLRQKNYGRLQLQKSTTIKNYMYICMYSPEYKPCNSVQIIEHSCNIVQTTTPAFLLILP